MQILLRIKYDVKFSTGKHISVEATSDMKHTCILLLTTYILTPSSTRFQQQHTGRQFRCNSQWKVFSCLHRHLSAHLHVRYTLYMTVFWHKANQHHRLWYSASTDVERSGDYCPRKRKCLGQIVWKGIVRGMEVVPGKMSTEMYRGMSKSPCMIIILCSVLYKFKYNTHTCKICTPKFDRRPVGKW